jgi:Cu2+-exporting ATPase
MGGAARPMCCPGCRAVASLIAESGLENFYRQRTAYNERPLQPELTAVEQYRGVR